MCSEDSENDQSVTLSATSALPGLDEREKDIAEHATVGLSEQTPFLPIHVSSAVYCDRLQQFLDFTGIHNRFSLTTLPNRARWGDDRLKSIMCVDGLPVTLLVLGELATVRALVNVPENRTAIFVGVDLLRDVDRSMRNDVILRVGNKFLPVDPLFQASRGQSSRDPLFQAVYDATTSYDDAHQMPKITIHDVLPGDIVLLECFIVRRGSHFSSPIDLTFMLDAMSLLVRAPRPQHPIAAH